MALTQADLPALLDLLNQIDIRVKWRRKTAAAWSSSTDVLLEGEAGLETDTGKFKLGNGTDIWDALPYAPALNGTVGCTFDGGGSVLPVGLTADVTVPYDCTIDAATLVGDPSGSIVISVWKDTLANYPPTSGDSIAGAAPPTLSSASHSRNTSLAGWTTTLNKGDVVRFQVQSCTAITRAVLALEVTRAS